MLETIKDAPTTEQLRSFVQDKERKLRVKQLAAALAYVGLGSSVEAE